MIAAFRILDDPHQAMGHKDDPRTTTPYSVLLTCSALSWPTASGW